MSRPRNIPRIIQAVSPLALLAACTSDVVDLGSNAVTQSLESSAQCAQSPIVRGPVEVLNQEQLDALRGCDEVRGDLHIRIYDGTDLRPLSSLRSVAGRFTLGGSPETEDPSTWEAEEAVRQQVIAAGWLSSLEGVESLERVGSLEIRHIAAPELRAFSNLRNLAGNHDPEYAGRLEIQEATGLVNLSGLENAAGVADLLIHDNPALESLFGLSISEVVPGFVSVSRNPRLTDIFALAPLESVDFLYIEGLAVDDLDALQGLTYARTIGIGGNPELIEMFAIADATFEELRIEDNPKLASIPEFANQRPDSRLTIARNQVLSRLALNYTPGDFAEHVAERELYLGGDWIEIHDNPSLETIMIAADLPAEDPESWFVVGRVFAAYRNPALWYIDLGHLTRLDLLSISDNPALTDLGFELERVDAIFVANNPRLVTAELRAVPTFEATFSGNADDTSAATASSSASSP